MKASFGHELVGVIKRLCYAHAGFAAQPILFVVGVFECDEFLRSLMEELALDDTLRTVVWQHEYPLRGSDERVSICLASATVIFLAKERSLLFEDQSRNNLRQKPLLQSYAQ